MLRIIMIVLIKIDLVVNQSFLYLNFSHAQPFRASTEFCKIQHKPIFEKPHNFEVLQNSQNIYRLNRNHSNSVVSLALMCHV